MKHVILMMSLIGMSATFVQADSWSAELLTTMRGFAVPECVIVDSATGVPYVSNIEATPDKYWADDGKGYISQLKIGGGVDSQRWVSKPLNSPKGMCILNGYLWATDNTRVVRFSLKTGKAKVYPVCCAVQINDMATDGKAIWASDTGAGKIYRIDPANGKVKTIAAVPAVNGITFANGKMFAVSWGQHEVYEMDPSGKAPPKPFGLAKHFKALDAIEVLADGTFIVSDFVGNRIVTISPDRKTVRTLIETKTPADIGLDRKRMLLYVPLLKHDTVEVYQLNRK